MSIGSVTGGTVTASPANASEGETVTLTVTPDEGKKLYSLSVSGSDGTVTLSEAAYNFSETPVTSDITLYIKWAYADFTGTFEEFLAADFVENEAVSPYNIKITSAANNDLTEIAKAIGLSSNQYFKGVYVKLDLSDCGATEIPNSAFWAADDYSGAGLATYLTGIVLPTGLTKINHYAFNKCSALSGSVTIPASVMYLGYQCFYDTNLSSLVYEDETSTWKKYSNSTGSLVASFSETACPTLSKVNGLWNGLTYLAKQ